MKSRIYYLVLLLIIFLGFADAHAQRFRLEEEDGSQLEVKFDAFRIEDRIQFVWSVSSESNISSYEIRRGSESGRFLDWAALTRVNVDHTKLGSYTFIDESPMLGEMHYRLKLIAPDGSSVEYSPLFRSINQQGPGGQPN